MEERRITNWEQLKGLPKGTVVRLGGSMPPPPGFARVERGAYSPVYVLGRVEYSGCRISPNRDTMTKMDDTIRVCGKDIHFNNIGCSTIYEEEWVEATGAVDVSAAFLHGKPGNWFSGVIFRANGRWYNNFPAYLMGLMGKTTPFDTAQEAADALTLRLGYVETDETTNASVDASPSLSVEKEAERLAAEKKARRDAEDAEMAALEAELADLERQEKLKQLRAKVAQMKE
jgi:hypothetical protein